MSDFMPESSVSSRLSKLDLSKFRLDGPPYLNEFSSLTTPSSGNDSKPFGNIAQIKKLFATNQKQIMLKKAIGYSAVGYCVYTLVKNIKYFSSQEHDFSQSSFKSFKERKDTLLKQTSEDSCVNEQPFFINKDGLYILYRIWNNTSATRPKGVVIICHGLNEHSLRYSHIAKAFNKKDIVVYSLDHQGHGLSEGTELFVKKFSDYVEDVLHLYKMAQTSFPNIPLFLLGHSMGGLIAIHTTHRIKAEGLPLAGVVYSSPALYLDPKATPPVLIPVINLLSKFLPKLRPAPLDVSTLTRDPVNLDKYANDPGRFHGSQGAFTVRLASELIKAIEEAQEDAKNFDRELPVYIVQGGTDALCPEEGSRRFFDTLKKYRVKNVTFEYDKEAFHEFFNEPHWRVGSVKKMVTWVTGLSSS
eukprot:maker-scaffold_55-snap-gene-0.44-mRNA-1 protein AED:0.07 eAED:0.07 QI:0/0.75/0.6/0.8/0.75/0.8/5/84/414